MGGDGKSVLKNSRTLALKLEQKGHVWEYRMIMPKEVGGLEMGLADS